MGRTGCQICLVWLNVYELCLPLKAIKRGELQKLGNIFQSKGCLVALCAGYKYVADILNFFHFFV